MSEFKLANKITVITGPVFTRTDRFYIKEFDDYPVRIPSAFWKIISYVDRNQNLNTQAYIFFQDVPSVASSNARARFELEDMKNLKMPHIGKI